MTSPSLYSASLYDFSRTNSELIISALQGNPPTRFIEKIELIQAQINELLHLAGHIIFDYQPCNSEAKIDVVFLYRGLVFVVVFKVGESEYSSDDIAMAHNLALELKEHHPLNQDKFIVPVVIATNAQPQGCDIQVSPNLVINPILDNGSNLAALLEHFSNQFKADEIDANAWEHCR
ncbi:hypothetical protein L4D20_21310 [Vibrio kyushuensis]|uniref:hypothetical protein n=1 Tax=Vibrio kyushuensis TaxID=2910249 RepID=UPI003D0AFEFB